MRQCITERQLAFKVDMASTYMASTLAFQCSSFYQLSTELAFRHTQATVTSLYSSRYCVLPTMDMTGMLTFTSVAGIAGRSFPSTVQCRGHCACLIKAGILLAFVSSLQNNRGILMSQQPSLGQRHSLVKRRKCWMKATIPASGNSGFGSGNTKP